MRKRTDLHRRILALVMAGAITLGNVPVSAFAEETYSTEIDVEAAVLDQSAEEAAEQAAEEARLAEEQAAAEEAERLAAEQAEAERLAAEQAEAERLAAEQAEAERLAAEQAEAERLAAEQAEAERLAAEQAEAERLAAEQAEAERLAAEQAAAEEAARLAAEQAEAERLAAEQAAAEEAARLAAEQAEAERLAAEQAAAEEAARVAAEQAEAEAAEAEQAAAEEEARLAQEQAAAEEEARLAQEQAEKKAAEEEEKLQAEADEAAEELLEAEEQETEEPVEMTAEFSWENDEYRMIASFSDGRVIPATSRLAIKTLEDLASSDEERENFRKALLDPAKEIVAERYELDKESEAFEMVFTGFIPFEVEVLDEDGNRIPGELNLSVEVRDGQAAEKLYLGELSTRVFEYDESWTPSMVASDEALISVDTVNGCYYAQFKTSAEYIGLLNLDMQTMLLAEAVEDAEQETEQQTEAPAETVSDEETEEPLEEEETEEALEEETEEALEEETESGLVEQTIFDPNTPEVTVSGLMPENAELEARAITGAELEQIQNEIQSELEEGTLFFINSAYDITIYDENGDVFEPDENNTTVTVEIDQIGIEENAAVDVFHKSDDGEITVEDRVNVEDGAIAYDADHFSITVNGLKYTELKGDYGKAIVKPASSTATLPTGGSVTKTLNVDFEFQQIESEPFYIELPAFMDGSSTKKIDYSNFNKRVNLKKADGTEVQAISVKLVQQNNKVYLLIDVDDEHAHVTYASGNFNGSFTVTNTGKITFNGGSITINPQGGPSGANTTVLTKSGDGPTPVYDEQGNVTKYKYDFKISVKNPENESIKIDIIDHPYNNGTYNAESGSYTYYTWDATNLSLTFERLTASGNIGPATLEYPASLVQDADTVPAGSSPITLTKGSWTSKGQIGYGYGKRDVVIPANTTFSWSYECYLSVEDAERLKEQKAKVDWSNGLYTQWEGRANKHVTAKVSYIANEQELVKTAVSPGTITGDMEWTIKLATSGGSDASGNIIRDSIALEAYKQGIDYIRDNPSEQPYVIIYKNGEVDRTIPLTWEEYTKEGEKDSSKIYFKDGEFSWFSDREADGNKYGYELHYWTNYDQEIMSQFGDTVNTVESGFTDYPLGRIGDGAYKTVVEIYKNLKNYNADGTVDWSSTVHVDLTDNATAVRITDVLPSDKGNYGSSTGRNTNYYDWLPMVDDNNYSTISDYTSKYATVRFLWLFNSVEEFESRTGFSLSVTDAETGELLNANEYLCEDGAKLGFAVRYWIGSHQTRWYLYPNVVGYTGGAADNFYVDNEYGRVLTSGQTHFVNGNYNINIDYKTIRSKAIETRSTIRTNTISASGVTALDNYFNVSAADSYFNTTKSDYTRLEKRLAAAEEADNDKVVLTYLATLDNRYNYNWFQTELKTLDEYVDTLSGLPEGSARFIPESFKLYRIPAIISDDTQTDDALVRWVFPNEASSISDLEDSQKFPPLALSGKLRSFEINDTSFTMTVDYSKITQTTTSDYQKYNSDWPEYIDRQVNENTGHGFLGKASYYLVYQVEVDKSALIESVNVHNVITSYRDGNKLMEDYVDYALDAKPLQKEITDPANEANGYRVTYGIKAHIVDELYDLDTVTISDTVSEKLKVLISTLKVYKTDSTFTPIEEVTNYVPMINGQNLSVVMEKPAGENWNEWYLVSYEAQINETAVGVVDYENSAVIVELPWMQPEHTHGETYISEGSATIVDIVLDIYKYDGDDGNSLSNAEFTLYTLDTGVSPTNQRALINSLKAGDIENSEEALRAYLDTYSGWTVWGTAKTDSEGKIRFISQNDSTMYFNRVYKLV